MTKYNSSKIESKWQKYWQDNQTFVSNNKSKKTKKYILTEFPYPSGEGLHMGHLRGYVAGDVTSRYNRMRGYEVMYPMGWDAFGLPAENFAIKTGVQPAVSTAANIKNAKRQMQSWGLSLDWSREINTTDPEYYKWTQWLFLQFYKKGLAYEATGMINWCPKDKTGLANEEVIDGKCDRCGSVVEKKNLRQWYLKITAYAEKLLQGLEKDLSQWPDQVKIQQENWIGKSIGAEIEFNIVIPDATKGDVESMSSGSWITRLDSGVDPRRKSGMTNNSVKVFTTRPDTIFGATYLVLAPEHPLVSLYQKNISNYIEVEKYIESVKSKTEIQRTSEGKEKTGVELKGIVAINPATNKSIPIYIADYVLSGYGTGAIMAVPAHDERDFEFANKFKLVIKKVIQPLDLVPRDPFDAPLASSGATIGRLDNKIQYDYWTGDGVLINSGKFSGMESKKAIQKMASVFGKPKIQYKLRDWVFSRQRYWGEPIPIIHCEKCGIVAVPDKDLPVLLPKVKKYEPTGTGESPLAAIDSWVNVECPTCKGNAKRETNTMPQWAGSSWYYLRYTDPKNAKAFAGKEALKYWLPVDTYFGGMEHTTLHLLYSRFWNLVFYDLKLVPVKEPYTKRVPHGIILASDGEKMSKSRGNVVNPDEIVKEHGADTLRMYEMFLGPHDAQVAWNDKGVIGVRRFLERVWLWGSEVGRVKAEGRSKTLVTSEKASKALNKLIKKITEDIETFHFNTAVSSFMEFLNAVKDEPFTKTDMINFLKLLYPFAPHISEELFEALGGKGSLQLQTWPNFDKNKIVDQTVIIMIQVSGKVRDKIEVPFNSSESEVNKLAMAQEKIKDLVGKALPKKIIFVPNKIINIVL